MKLLIFFLLVSVCVFGAMADPGPTDENGGHYNRETGAYHYHNAPINSNQQSVQTLITIKAEALTNAERDAKASNAWYHYGFFFGPFAIGAAYVIPATPRAENLLGKSPEYITLYTQYYKEEVREERAKEAAIGCAVSVGITIVLRAILSDN